MARSTTVLVTYTDTRFTTMHSCSGPSGTTYGVETDDGLLVQTKYANGVVGTVSLVSWPMARWSGQMGAIPVDGDVPDSIEVER